jgi:hypothetical protein
MDDTCYRFGQSQHIEIRAFRRFYNKMPGHTHIFRKSAINIDSNLLSAGAIHQFAASAIITAPAAMIDINDCAYALSNAALRTGLNHPAGKLMPRHQRHPMRHEFPVIDMRVCSTNAATRNLQKHLMGLNLRDWAKFQLKSARLDQNCSPHF